MIIEVTGASVRNKGAELMLATVARRFAEHADVELAVTGNFGPYQSRAKYGLLQKVQIERLGRAKLGFALLPDGFRKNSGLVTEDDIDAVVDISGFAFGDQLPIATAQRVAAQCQRWKAQGKPVVLLPQAFGPFEDEPTRSCFERIVSHCELIYARDPESQRHALKVSDRILLAPDITIGIEGMEKSDCHDIDHRTVLIVPNARMLDRTSSTESEMYLPFLKRCVHSVNEQGMNPVFLIHDENEDEALASAVVAQLDQPVPIVWEKDPLVLKGVLAQARAVIGSRFHALVSALSGGVPVLAAGWSHKYERLLEDFGCAGQVLPVGASAPDIASKVRDCCDADREPLISRKEKMVIELNQMWDRVMNVLRVAN